MLKLWENRIPPLFRIHPIIHLLWLDGGLSVARSINQQPNTISNGWAISLPPLVVSSLQRLKGEQGCVA